MFSDQAVQHGFHAQEDGIDIQQARLKNLLPAEGQQLSGECGSPLGSFVDLFSVAACVAVSRQILEQKCGVAEDRGEQIVKVVRDTAGELPDRLHSLRLPQLFFKLMLVGDVAEHNDSV